MITIKIIGANCSKCKKVHEKIHLLVKEYNIPASVLYSDNTSALYEYNIISIPAVIINDKVEFKGIVPSKRHLINVLNQYLPEQRRIIIPKSNHSVKYFLLLIFIALIAFGIRAILIRDKNELLCTDPADAEVIKAKTYPVLIADSISILYDYSINAAFEMTFLEFGAIGCRSCKMMEIVLEEITLEFGNKVNVVFYNVNTEKGGLYADYYDIKMIPVQVFLNKNGTEVFRHTGYYSTEEVKQTLESYGIK